MKLPFEKYNPDWSKQFEAIKNQLETLLQSLDIKIEHIGSTSVEGLSVKPIVDILIGMENEKDLDKIPSLLAGDRFIYYEVYNDDMPYRRFFVMLKDLPSNLGLPTHIKSYHEISEKLNDNNLRLAHIHAIPTSSEHWTRHIAFRDYLRAHPEVKQQYQTLKEELIKKNGETGMSIMKAKMLF